MDDASTPAGELDEFDPENIERAVLNDTEEGRRVAATFVKMFGDFVTTNVRPVLVTVAADGGEPQLLVNGLAALLRATAEAIEFPIDHPRAGSPSRAGAGTDNTSAAGPDPAAAESP